MSFISCISIQPDRLYSWLRIFFEFQQYLASLLWLLSPFPLLLLFFYFKNTTVIRHFFFCLEKNKTWVGRKEVLMQRKLFVEFVFSKKWGKETEMGTENEEHQMLHLHILCQSLGYGWQCVRTWKYRSPMCFKRKSKSRGPLMPCSLNIWWFPSRASCQHRRKLLKWKWSCGMLSWRISRKQVLWFSSFRYRWTKEVFTAFWKTYKPWDWL